jgi:hypothetical protein
MQTNRLRGFTESSGGSSTRHEGGRFRLGAVRSGGRGVDGPGGGVRKGSAVISGSAHQEELDKKQIHPSPPLQRRELTAKDEIAAAPASVVIEGVRKGSYEGGEESRENNPFNPSTLRQSSGQAGSGRTGYLPTGLGGGDIRQEGRSYTGGDTTPRQKSLLREALADFSRV